MTLKDVQAAIERSRASRIEDAFRILVAWPNAGTITGIRTAEEATSLLQATAGALIRLHDTRVMPFEVMSTLERIAAENGEALVGGWYATGAMFVANRLEAWRGRFERSLMED